MSLHLCVLWTQSVVYKTLLWRVKSFLVWHNSKQCLQGFPPLLLLLPRVLQGLIPLYSLSVTYQQLARPAFYNLSNSFLDVTSTELSIQCFIHPTGSLTVNRLKIVILLSGNTTWRGPTQTHSHIHKHKRKHTVCKLLGKSVWEEERNPTEMTKW